MAQKESLAETENIVTSANAKRQEEKNVFSEEFEEQRIKQREQIISNRKSMVKNVFTNEKMVTDYHTLFLHSILVEKGETTQRGTEKEQPWDESITIPNIVAVMIPILIGIVVWTIKYGRHDK